MALLRVTHDNYDALGLFCYVRFQRVKPPFHCHFCNTVTSVTTGDAYRERFCGALNGKNFGFLGDGFFGFFWVAVIADRFVMRILVLSVIVKGERNFVVILFLHFTFL